MSFGAMSLGIKAENLPTSTHSCPVNLTLKEPEFVDHLRVSDLEYPERILGLSYTQLGPLGFTVTLLVGVIVSIATGMSKGVKVNKAYLHPCVRRFVTENDPSVKKKRTTILNNSSRSKNEEDYILTSTQM
ncbi:hypothetical protein Pmani_012750 [Petrolisthes manimaculis]|uniref:Uncharacterized protein n=1 Tax=Petrolisthes manimaculis TaxID=1843537 RepID=A0AAE1PXB0_9EUCA|nr:hypothetical protein Pmani_012750 [Petrolisthes manimaculis]